MRWRPNMDWSLLCLPFAGPMAHGGGLSQVVAARSSRSSQLAGQKLAAAHLGHRTTELFN